MLPFHWERLVTTDVFSGSLAPKSVEVRHGPCD